MAREPRQEGPPPTAELVSHLVDTLSQLLSRHVELAKAEAVEQARRELKTASSLTAAAALGYAGMLLFLATGVTALMLVVPPWAAALIMGGFACVAGGTVGLIGFRRRVRRPMGRTREIVREDVRWLRPTTA